jgi:hypothetical protein
MFFPTRIPKFFKQNRTIVDIAAGLYHSFAIAECSGMYVPHRIFSIHVLHLNRVQGISFEVVRLQMGIQRR